MAALALTGSATSRIFGWAASLLDLMPSLVLAVPKSKISHSRKSMRSANKGLKDKQNIVNCPACGEAKLAHHVCQNCFKTIAARWRAETRAHTKTHKGAVSGGSWIDRPPPQLVSAPGDKVKGIAAPKEIDRDSETVL